MIAFT